MVNLTLKPLKRVLKVFKSVKLPSTANLLYIGLLASAFVIGYLFSRVQSLEKSAPTQVLGQTQATGDQTGQVQQQQPQPPAKVDVAVGKLPALGSENAKVTIVEFSDLQCPFCRRFFNDAFIQLKKEYIDTGKVKLYFRHYPLPFHPSAEPSALASECANEQGKFWAFHDKVYEEQTKKDPSGGTVEYTKEDLKKWASELGLDTSQFNSCFDSNKYKSNIETDKSDATTAVVDGTPTFFVNGNRLIGAQPFEAFKQAIDQELNK